MAVVLIGTSSILGAINFLVTIFKMRAPGMTMFRMPILVWTVLVTSVLVLLATPVLASALIMLFIDRNYGGHFFDPATGGNAILWQNVFWFYSHPAVYIMILPAMGIVSEVLPVFSRKPLFGYKAFVFATAGIGALGFSVWAHHMFTTGRGLPAVLQPHDVPDRGAHRRQDVQLDRDAVPRPADVLDAAALRARLPVDVPDRRHQRRVQRRRAGRLRPPRHVLGRRASPLRAVRRLRLRRLRRHLLLVPQDDRPDAQRDPGQDPVRADVHRLQPDVLPDARPRPRRHAAAHRRLQLHGRLEPAEPAGHDRQLHDRGEHAAVPVERLHLAAQRQDRRRRPVGGQHARVGDLVAAAALQLRPAAR